LRGTGGTLSRNKRSKREIGVRGTKSAIHITERKATGPHEERKLNVRFRLAKRQRGAKKKFHASLFWEGKTATRH